MGTESKAVKNQKKAVAQKLVSKLLRSGVSPEGLAVKLDVSLATVLRWRDGVVAPQTGRLNRLQTLAKESRA